MQSKRGTTGVVTRHARSCSTKQGAKCSCRPSFQANVWSSREGIRIFKTFPTLAAAKAWRADAQVGLRKGTMRAPTRITVREAAEAWLEGVKSGAIHARGGNPYKPSAIRSYEGALRQRVVPHFGGTRLSDVRHIDLQDFADRLRAEGLDPSTIRNTLMPLRTIYRRAVARGDVGLNPTSGLELPAVTGRRDRVATQAEASALLAALPIQDRALWATALYAGLRRGELLALRWEDVSLASGHIRIERSWDERAGFIEPKSRASKRRVPIVGVLREHLIGHRQRTDRDEGLVFGTTATHPPTPSNLGRRAHEAWRAANLNAIGLHECRHTFASLMIDAGINAKALTVYMGHASVATTYDLYGKLMPGNEDQAVAVMDAYFERADTAARLAQIAESDR
jgi:integrase